MNASARSAGGKPKASERMERLASAHRGADATRVGAAGFCGAPRYPLLGGCESKNFLTIGDQTGTASG
jgi:hypothetical protein